MLFRRIIQLILGAALLAASASARADEGDAILVLDASGSMWGQIDETAKIAIAKSVLGDLLADLPAERRLGLIAYGHRREGDCADIEEIAPVGADRAAIAAAVEGLSPKGKTPMADSIKLAAEKLRYTEEKATVILISDGVETCAPDPCGVAAALEEAGADFTTHIIGFDVSEENAQAQLRCIAENTGGLYVSASNAAELSEALETTVVAAPEAAAPEANLWLRATELEGGLLIEEGLAWIVAPSAGGEAVLSEENAGVVEAAIEPGTYDVSVVRPADGLKGEAKGIVIHPNATKTVTIALTFPVEASLRVEPENEAMAGTNIKAHFTGPERQGDYISIAKKGADDGATETYAYARSGNPAELRMPVEPGDYEIRYVLGRPIRVLARADFAATPATASLTAPDDAVAGAEIAVAFTGPPAGSGDYVTITAPDAPDREYMSYAYSAQGSPASLRMPLEPGDYELRFVQGGSRVLARRPITVTQALATVTAPERAVIGATVDVEFTGPPPASGDYITVTAPEAPANEYSSYVYTRQGSPAEIRMPVTPGDYEIRYIQGNEKIIARQTIRVEEAAASVAAKSSAIAGETVSVEFSGPPAGSGDFITVAAPSAPDREYTDYKYARNGSPAEIRMPLDAGDYEIRYVLANTRVIARQAITVTPAAATLSAPDRAAAGSEIRVEFTGPPPGSGDFITVTAPEAGERAYMDYAYARNGSPATIRMLEEPGQYELRFVQGNERVLARRPIAVTPADDL
jgi:Ca-activated chloride channel family protein